MMEPVIAGVTACLLYLSASTLRFLQLRKIMGFPRPILLGLVALAVLCHAYSTLGEMFTENGINLRIQVMGSLISLAVATIMLLSSLRRPVDNLFLIFLPVAAVTILISHFGTNNYVARNDLSWGILSHILFSVLAYSLLTVAAFQAILLFAQDHGLRHSKLPVLQSLPPLQTMEALLFELLSIGLIFLSISIVSGFLFLENIAEQHLIHHTVITISAWIVFSLLLWGRYHLGWRGAKASKWTFAGFALLLVGYFGSKLVLEIIL